MKLNGLDPVGRALSRGRIALALLVLALGGLPALASADALKDGKAALQANRLDEALADFEKAASGGSAEGRASVGLVWLKRRQLIKAREAFVLAEKMDATLALPFYGEGEVLHRQGNCAEAIPLLQKATALDRKFPEAQLSLGKCLVESNQHAQAVDVLNEGLKWGPKWRPKFLVALGDAELARDSLRDAGIYYHRAVEEAADDPTPRRALGDFYMKRGTFELAVPEYQAATALDSSDVELRFALGQSLLYAQRYNEALEILRDVVARDPEFAPGELALGDLYFRSGQADHRRYADARAPLEKYVSLAPDSAKGWSVLGRTYYQLGLRDSAFEALNRADRLGDKIKETYTFRARLHVDRKEWDAAMADYARGEPAAEDFFRMAQVYVIQGNLDRADSLYRSIVEKDSTSGNGKFAITEWGKLKYRQKDYPGAIALFQRRIALDPNSDEAYYYQGLSYKELKQYPEAVAALRQSVALADGKLDRHFWLGMIYAELDSVAGATRELGRVVEADTAGTGKYTGTASRQLGYYQLLAKNNTEAIRFLERAVAINDKDLQAWVWLGQGCQNAGNKSRACEAYDRALAIDPNQAVALKGKKSLGC